MRSICFYFQVHQPYRLKHYRFFDIGKDHNYYDDYQNEFIARRVADKCYLPMNQLLLDSIKEFGSMFKVSFSISGTASIIVGNSNLGVSPYFSSASVLYSTTR
jgi:alpha-amylase